MSKLDEKVGTYIHAVRTKCDMEPDVDLLRKVTRGLGPTIYRNDAETIAASDPKELERIKKNFLVKKLGLSEDDDLDAGIDAAVERYGRSDRSKYRAVIYYLLVKHFGKEGVYA
jgi:hypothetical protein